MHVFSFIYKELLQTREEFITFCISLDAFLEKHFSENWYMCKVICLKCIFPFFLTLISSMCGLHYFGLTFGVIFWGPFVEELFKGIQPVNHWVLALVEYSFRNIDFYDHFINLFPLCMHLSLKGYTFSYRFFFHALWNAFALYIVQPLYYEFLEECPVEIHTESGEIPYEYTSEFQDEQLDLVDAIFSGKDIVDRSGYKPKKVRKIFPLPSPSEPVSPLCLDEISDDIPDSWDEDISSESKKLDFKEIEYYSKKFPRGDCTLERKRVIKRARKIASKVQAQQKAHDNRKKEKAGELDFNAMLAKSKARSKRNPDTESLLLSNVDLLEKAKMFARILVVGDYGIPVTQYEKPIFVFLCYFYRVSRVRDASEASVIYIDMVREFFPHVSLVGASLNALAFYTTMRGLSALFKSKGIDEDDIFRNPGDINTESYEAQFDKFRSVFNCILESELLIGLRDFIMDMVSLQFFDIDHARSLKKLFGKPDKISLAVFFWKTMDFISKLLRSGDRFLEGGSLQSILQSDNPISELECQVKHLLMYKTRLYTGLPIAGYMCEREYCMKGDECDAIYEAIKPRLNALRAAHYSLEKLCLELRMSIIDIRAKNKASLRAEPITLMLFGDPKIGKSKILFDIYTCHSNVRGRKFHISHVYEKVMSSPFWEQYTNQPYCHLSEAGNISEALARAKGDETIAQICSLSDTLPYPLDMAFDRKGMAFFDSEFLAFDSNNPYLHAKYTLSNPAALFRRFIYVKPTVKPQFREDYSCGIDSAKSLAAGGDMMDRWTFEVYFEDAQDCVNSNKRILMAGGPEDDIYKLRTVLTKYFTEHISNANAVREKLNEASSTQQLSKPVEEISESVVEDNGREEIVSSDSIIDDSSSEGSTLLDEHDFDEGILSESQFLSWFAAYYFSFVYYPQYFSNVLLSLESFHRVVNVFSRCTLNVSNLVGCMLRVALFYGLISIFGINAYDLEQTRIKLSYLNTSWIAVVLFFACYGNFPTFVLSIVAVYYLTYYVIVPMVAKKIMCRLRENVYTEFWVSFLDLHEFIMGDFEDQRDWRMKYGLYCVTGVASSYVVWCGLRKLLDLVVSTESSDFKLSSSANADLNAIEKEANAAESYARVKIHNHDVWNTRELGTIGVSNKNPRDLRDQISSSVREIYVESDKIGVTKGLGICSNYMVVNNHAFANCKFPVKIRVSKNGFPFTKNDVYMETILSEFDYHKFRDDLALIRVAGIRFKDIVKHIPEDEIYPDTCGGAHMYGTSRFKYLHKGIVMNNPYLGKIPLRSAFEYNWDDHKAGHCGSPLIVEKGSTSVVVAIHSAGGKDTSSCYGELLIKREVQDAIKHLDNVNPFINILSESDDMPECTPPHPKSPFHYEDLRHLRYMGRLARYTATINQKSSVLKSPLGSSIKQRVLTVLGKEETEPFGPPPMKPFVKNGEYISPYNIALKSIARPRKALNKNVLKKVVDKIVQRILEGTGDVSLAPLDLLTAINGAKNDPFIRRMNTSTASGYGWIGKKGDILPIVSEEDNEVTREPIEPLKKRILSVLHDYKLKRTKGFIYQGKLKDEPRLMSKNLKGKTRMFFVAPTEDVIIARSFLAPFYSLMVERGSLFCTAIGINMHREADKVIGKLLDFSPLLFEGDYRNYDQHMPFDISYASASIIYQVCQALGYNSFAMRMVGGALSDALHPLLEVNGDLFSEPGDQPSGKFATAEDNSLKGLIMLMYVWYAHPRLAHLDFFEYVLPVIFGDDVLGAVKPEVSRWFNSATYQGLCKEHFDLDFTNASKTDNMTPFMTTHECSFLKRNFTQRDGKWIAPLDFNSILKTIEWRIPSKFISEEVQVCDSLNSVLWELYFHLDEDNYEDIRIYLIDSVHGHYGTSYPSLTTWFPSYQDLKEVFSTSC